MRTEAELDERAAMIVAKYPAGLTPEQFSMLTLESVDEDGRVYPPWVEFFAMMSMIIRMQMVDGTITHRGGYNSPIIPNLFITDKGRKFLESETS